MHLVPMFDISSFIRCRGYGPEYITRRFRGRRETGVHYAVRSVHSVAGVAPLRVRAKAARVGALALDEAGCYGATDHDRGNRPHSLGRGWIARG